MPAGRFIEYLNSFAKNFCDGTVIAPTNANGDKFEDQERPSKIWSLYLQGSEV